jgi:NTP pyrophosphatase (non-canonical NTP hydrolase)
MQMFDNIRRWAAARNLIQGSTPAKQFGKLEEEVTELAEAIAKDDYNEFVDAIGDCIVVLTIMASQKGLNVEDCIAAAWAEIKDRKGRMVDGVFVKEAA